MPHLNDRRPGSDSKLVPSGSLLTAGVPLHSFEVYPPICWRCAKRALIGTIALGHDCDDMAVQREETVITSGQKSLYV